MGEKSILVEEISKNRRFMTSIDTSISNTTVKKNTSFKSENVLVVGQINVGNKNTQKYVDGFTLTNLECGEIKFCKKKHPQMCKFINLEMATKEGFDQLKATAQFISERHQSWET